MSSQRRLNRLLLPLLLALTCSVGCHAATPLATPLAAANVRVLDSRDGGGASLAVSLKFGAARRLQSALHAYDPSDVNHVVLSLAKFNGASFVPLVDGSSQPIQLDLVGDALAGAVTISHLQRGGLYQVFAQAYKNPGTNAADLISLVDASASASVSIDNAEAPQPLALQMTLIDRDVTSVFPAVAAAVDADPGTGGLQVDPNVQTDAAVAYSAVSNRYMLVWQDQRVSPSVIYGQVLGTDGSSLGVPVQISDGLSASAHPAIAYDSVHNTFLVAWEGISDTNVGSSTGGASDIVGRVISPSGGLPGAQFDLVAPPDTSTQTRPALAFNATDDEFFATWQDDRYNGLGDGQDVLFQRFNASSFAPIGPLDSMGAGQQAANRSAPAVSWSAGTDIYVLAWEDDATGNGDIYVRGLQAIGVNNILLGTDPLMFGDGALQTSPALAYNSHNGETLAVWQDGRNIGTTGSTTGYDLYTQRISPSFVALGGETPVLAGADADSDQLTPQAIFNSVVGEYLLAWVEAPATTAPTTVYGAHDNPVAMLRLSGAGAAVGTKVSVAAGGNDARNGPTLAYANSPSENRALLLWNDLDGGSNDTFYRQIDSQLAP